MSGVRGDARKRQQGEHLTHWDAGVRAVIEREVAKERERIAQAFREKAGPATAPGCPAAADRSFWLRAADEVAALRQGDSTHGSNHAPLTEGVLLDPGYCEGCDMAREAGQS